MSCTLRLPYWTWRRFMWCPANKSDMSRYFVITGVLPLEGNERLARMLKPHQINGDRIYVDFSTQNKQVYHRKLADGSYEWEFHDTVYLKVVFAHNTMLGGNNELSEEEYASMHEDFQSIPVANINGPLHHP